METRSEPPLSFDVAVENFGDEDGAKQFIINFEENTFQKDILTNIEENLKEQNYPELRRFSHSLKGAARYVGAKTFADLASHLQEAAEQKNFEKAKTLYAELLKEGNILQKYIQDHYINVEAEPETNNAEDPHSSPPGSGSNPLSEQNYLKEDKECTTADTSRSSRKPETPNEFQGSENKYSERSDIHKQYIILIHPPEKEASAVETILSPQSVLSPQRNYTQSPKLGYDKNKLREKSSFYVGARGIDVIEEEKMNDTSTLGNNSERQDAKKTGPLNFVNLNSNNSIISMPKTRSTAHSTDISVQLDISPAKHQRDLREIKMNTTPPTITWTVRDCKDVKLKKPLPPGYKVPVFVSKKIGKPSFRMRAVFNDSKYDDYPFDKGLKCNIF